jgi:hypothetical protein
MGGFKRLKLDFHLTFQWHEVSDFNSMKSEKAKRIRLTVKGDESPTVPLKRAVGNKPGSHRDPTWERGGSMVYGHVEESAMRPSFSPGQPSTPHLDNPRNT